MNKLRKAENSTEEHLLPLQLSSLDFSVEKIINVVTSEGRRYYQVKWFDTWIDEVTLADKCQHLIEAYWASVEEEVKYDLSLEPSPLDTQSSDINHVTPSTIPVGVYETGETLIPVTQVSANNPITELKPQFEPSITCAEKESTHLEGLSVDQQSCNIHVSNTVTQVISDQSSSINGDLVSICEFCGKKLSSKKVLKRHVVLVHLKNGRHQCSMCDRRFFSSHELNRHMPVHTNEKKYPCSVCGKCFKQAGQAYKHMQTHIGEKKFECEVCGRKFLHRNNLHSHFSTHTNVKMFECGHCKAKFKHKQSVYTHFRNAHSGQREFLCKVCDTGFKNHKALTHHIKTAHENGFFQCTMCPRKFMVEKYLQYHIEKHKKGYIIPVKKVLQPKIKSCNRFSCLECQCSFPSLTRMNAHLSLHVSLPCKICTKMASNIIENIVNSPSNVLSESYAYVAQEQHSNSRNSKGSLSSSNGIESPTPNQCKTEIAGKNSSDNLLHEQLNTTISALDKLVPVNNNAESCQKLSTSVNKIVPIATIVAKHLQNIEKSKIIIEVKTTTSGKVDKDCSPS